MTSVSWHGSIKIMTSYQMVGCHNCFYLKLLGTTIKLKKYKNICHLQPNACNTLIDKQLERCRYLRQIGCR